MDKPHNKNTDNSFKDDKIEQVNLKFLFLF